MLDSFIPSSDEITNSRMRSIASQHEVTKRLFANKIRFMQARNYVDLQLIRHQLSHFLPGMAALIPASHWLFENYYLLYRDLKAFQASGGVGRFNNLPVIKNGLNKGYPRIFVIASEMVDCSNMHLNDESVIDMVREYQTVRILETKELNLLPDILSFYLRDKIIEEAKRIIPTIEKMYRVDTLMHTAAPLLEKGSAEAFSFLKANIRQADIQNYTFSSHLAYRLRSLSLNQKDITVLFSDLLHVSPEEGALLLTEITEKERLFESESENTMSSLITSLKEIADLDRDRYFNSVSVLESTLGQDPDGVYLQMDEMTRARYRAAVVKLADHHKTGEIKVAQAALRLCGSPPHHTRFPVPHHVGTYLLGVGKPYLKASILGRSTDGKDRSAIFKKLSHSAYFVGMLLITISIIPLIAFAAGLGLSDLRPGIIAFLLTLLIPSSGVAVFILNNLFTRMIKPKITLAMNFEKGIPDTCRTFVVMPVILSSPASARRCVATLERHYLANNMDNLFFALLVDFKDAAAKTLDEDSLIIAAAEEDIAALNQKYTNRTLIFSLFYREREWNPAQNSWMGRERKRGKLEDFNLLLAGATETAYLIPIGDPDLFPSIKYVITLDEDTELPPESAFKLIGAIEHPLNQPVLDPTGSRVLSGYVIIQSEVRNRIPGPSAGIFQRVLSGQAGFDPYATIVSDVYQDTFDEGIYAGKGIYQLKAFHQILYQSIPENQVLSHDLLEGSLTRCAFDSGIKLVDKAPASVDAYIRREHRWIRGDWQLLPYIFGRAKIKPLSRWKMLDNLRRSIMLPAQLILIACNIFLLPQAPWIWLIFLFYEPVIRILTTSLSMIINKIRHLSARFAFLIYWENVNDTLLQSLYSFTLLPIRAYQAIDAIVRTLYRLLISHRNLLEWQTFESVEKDARTSLKHYIRLMYPAFLPAAMLISSLFLPVAWPYRILFLLLSLLWALSPLIASLSGKRLPQKILHTADAGQITLLRQLAAKTWSYFVDFADEEHHWLCPDHYQEYPGPKTEDKTSPTNIGLQLLAILSARDLGYLSLFSFVESCERILSVVSRLPTWHGHLYNWYSSKTLQIIEPQYISTVDSGNFVAHLITLKNGLKFYMRKPVYLDTLHLGLNDYLQMEKAESTGQSTQSAAVLTTGSSFDRLNSLYHLVDELVADPHTGARTKDLCLGLIEDKQRLTSDKLADLLKTPNELADEGVTDAAGLISRIERLIIDIDYLVDHTDFQPLYDSKKRLFRIGYHITLQQFDRGYYDLMASEARLTSFLAVAKGDIPKRHWMSLGRPMTLVKGIPALVSWSGSMFEYLMPNLVLRVPHGSILDHSCRAAIISQIRYGRKMGFTWGISESQYFVFDNQGNYQYSPFGVSRMRLQSTLQPARVVAPYATMLALGTAPQQALKNIQSLITAGAAGRYGLYEALDFNSPELSTFKNYSLVRCFMTHHQGMSLAAINNYLNADTLQARFHSEPMIRASEILLEETFTNALVTVASIGYTINFSSSDIQTEHLESRIFNEISTPYPIAHVLSNGRYQLMLTTQGDGFSAVDHMMINRWRPNLQGEGNGTFIYIRETGTGRFWSSAYHPVMVKPDSYQVIFSHDKAEYRRKDGPITTHTEITLSPIDQLEIRRVTLTNHSERTVTLELSSYLEVVADDYMADVSHPAYSKLFIDTKFDADRKMLVATRRPKRPDEKNGYVMHLVSTDARLVRPVGYETSRQSFIGRGGTLQSPDILKSGHPFSEKGGSQTDPILCLQVVISINPGRSAAVSFITGYCPSMAAVISLSDKLAATSSDEDIFKLSRTSSLLEIEYLKIHSAQINAIQNLVGAIYYPTMAFKNTQEILQRNRLGQSGLWRFSISGDKPVLLLRIASIQDRETLKDVLLAYEFLRLQKVAIDLVILNEAEGGYHDDLQQMIYQQTSTIRVFDQGRLQSGIFILHAFHISAEEKDLLLSVARIIFTPQTGIYFRGLETAWPEEKASQAILLPSGGKPMLVNDPDYSHHGEPIPVFFNGLGGFSRDGREYEIRLNEGIRTPAPWINVIANEHFGFQISEIGAGYTWAGNSRENKLTTWYNDPVLDPVSEAVYIRDKDSGAITSPCALLPGAEGHFHIRHGFGYSVFERQDANINQSLTVFAAADQPVKLLILTIKNKTDEPANLTASFYAEWVLGAFREQTAPYLLTAFDRDTEILTARNAYGNDNNEGTAFIFASEPVASFTGDRLSFIGDGGTVRFPYGLADERLSESVGAGLDACGVLQCDVQLAPGSAKTVVFGLGHSKQQEGCKSLAARFRELSVAEASLASVRQYWNKITSAVTVRTPDRAMDILMNGWLIYQVISCRLRAKAAFYQCGGAFGFRDQLQDVLAVLHVSPELTRSHILLCCSRQFVEGDVQHWWHESDGVGVRTRISDDLLWLPYAVAEYLQHTGEAAFLTEQVAFLDDRILKPGEQEFVSSPKPTLQTADIYTHCVLAIDHACRFGQHGLPLIKGGDWNDGMNLVGQDERGESVWLGWFLYSVLQKFIPICKNFGDPGRADHYSAIAGSLAIDLEKHAWDGEWYLRAFFDNGQPLGSAQNEECRIDSISQSWAVLSQGADMDRSARALHAAERYLVKPEDGLVLLLAPPFDKSSNNPGYIMGYSPGIRENGGQYTHAAVWLAMAYCAIGNCPAAYRLLNMINPIHMTSDFRSVSRYEREPYVMTADISNGFPNTGKGGWSWYTGSAGWMYLAILNHFLGVRKEGRYLVFEPCVSSAFDRYQIEYCFGLALYEITFQNESGVGNAIGSLRIDGVLKDGNQIELIDDGAVHHVEIQLSNGKAGQA